MNNRTRVFASSQSAPLSTRCSFFFSPRFSSHLSSHYYADLNKCWSGKVAKASTLPCLTSCVAHLTIIFILDAIVTMMIRRSENVFDLLLAHLQIVATLRLSHAFLAYAAAMLLLVAVHVCRVIIIATINRCHWIEIEGGRRQLGELMHCNVFARLCHLRWVTFNFVQFAFARLTDMFLRGREMREISLDYFHFRARIRRMRLICPSIFPQFIVHHW